jgi:hypothetical protein
MLPALRSSHNAADLRPDREGGCPSFSMLGGGKVIAEMEEVVERCVRSSARIPPDNRFYQ